MDICHYCEHPIPTHQTKEEHYGMCDASLDNKKGRVSNHQVFQKFEVARKALFDLERTYEQAGNETDRRQVYALRCQLANIFDYPNTRKDK